MAELRARQPKDNNAHEEITYVSVDDWSENTNNAMELLRHQRYTHTRPIAFTQTLTCCLFCHFPCVHYTHAHPYFPLITPHIIIRYCYYHEDLMCA